MTLFDPPLEGVEAVRRWLDASEGVCALQLGADDRVLAVSRAFLRRSGRTDVELELSDLFEDPGGAPLVIASTLPRRAPLPRRLRARGDDSLWRVMAFDLADGRRMLLGWVEGSTASGHAREEALLDIELANAQSELHRANVELRSANSRINQLSRLDSLTGLANRREFDYRLADEVARCQRRPRPLSLIFCDIDHFKAVNDTHGHAAGDAVLAGLADVLRAGVRETDLAARIGGEEFAVVVAEGPLDAARALAERLRSALAAQIMDPIGAAVTASFGVAERRSGESAVELLARADAALYAAKRSGRNRVHADP